MTEQQFAQGFKNKEWAKGFFRSAHKGQVQRTSTFPTGHCEDNTFKSLGNDQSFCVGFFLGDSGAFTPHIWNRTEDRTHLPLNCNFYVWKVVSFTGSLSRNDFWDLAYSELRK